MAAKLGAKLSICAVNVARGGVRGPLIYSWEDDQVKKILDTAAAAARKAGAGHGRGTGAPEPRGRRGHRSVCGGKRL